MRKRKLYLSEFCKRNQNFDTKGVLYDEQDNKFEFESFRELMELEEQTEVTYEILEWTYTHEGYIILVK